MSNNQNNKNNNSNTENLVLEEEMDENYEPTNQEIEEYAEWLGMDKERDKDLMWIAKEGLKAPLPNPWKPCQTQDGEIFYFNFESGESVWDHPCDEHYRKVFDEEKKKRDARLAAAASEASKEKSDKPKKQKKKKQIVDLPPPILANTPRGNLGAVTTATSNSPLKKDNLNNILKVDGLGAKTQTVLASSDNTFSRTTPRDLTPTSALLTPRDGGFGNLQTKSSEEDENSEEVAAAAAARKKEKKARKRAESDNFNNNSSDIIGNTNNIAKNTNENVGHITEVKYQQFEKDMETARRDFERQERQKFEQWKIEIAQGFADKRQQEEERMRQYNTDNNTSDATAAATASSNATMAAELQVSRARELQLTQQIQTLQDELRMTQQREHRLAAEEQSKVSALEEAQNKLQEELRAARNLESDTVQNRARIAELEASEARLLRDIANMKERETQLTVEFDQRNTEIERLQRQKMILETQATAVEEGSSVANSRQKLLEEDISSLQKEVDMLRKKETVSTAALATAKEEIISKDGVISSLTETLKKSTETEGAISNENMTLRSKLRAAQADAEKVQLLSATSTSQEAEVSKLRSNLQKAEFAKMELESAIARMQGDLEEQKRLNSDNQEKIKTYENERVNNKTSLQDADINRDKLEGDVRSLEKEKSHLENAIKRTERERLDAESRLEIVEKERTEVRQDLERQIIRLTDDRDSLQREKTNLTARVASLETRNKSYEKENSELHELRYSGNKEREERMQKETEWRSERQNFESRIRELEDLQRNLQRESTEYEEEKRRLKFESDAKDTKQLGEIESLKAQIEQKSHQIEAMKQVVDSNTDSSAQAAADTLAQTTELEGQVFKLQAKIAEISQGKDLQDMKIQFLEGEKEKLEAEKNDLYKQRDEMSKQHADFELKKHENELNIEQLRQNVQKLEDSIKVAKTDIVERTNEFESREKRLQTEIDELQKQLKEAKTENEVQREEAFSKLQTSSKDTRVNELEVQLKEEKKKCADLEDQKTTLEQDKEDIQIKRASEIKLLRSKIATLEENLENEQTGRQLEEAREEATTIKKERNRLNDRVNYLESECQSLKEKVSKLDIDVSQKEDETVRCKNETEVCKKLITDLQQERAKLLSEATQHDTSIVELNEKMRKINDENTQLESSRTEVEIRNEELMREVEKLKSESSSLRRQIDEFDDEARVKESASTAQKVATQQRINALQDTEETLKTELKGARNRIKSLQQEVAELSSLSQKAALGDNELKSKLDQTRQQNTDLEDECSALKSMIERSKSQHRLEVENLKKEIQLLQSTQEASKRLQEQLKSETNSLRDQIDSASSGQDAQVVKMRSEINKLNEKIQVFESEKVASKDETTSVQKALETLKNEKNKIQKKYEQLQADYDGLKEEKLEMERSAMNLVQDVDLSIHPGTTKTNVNSNLQKTSENQNQLEQNPPSQFQKETQVLSDGALSDLDLLSDEDVSRIEMVDSTMHINNKNGTSINQDFFRVSDPTVTYNEAMKAIQSLRRLERAKALIQQKALALKTQRVALETERKQWQRDWNNINAQLSDSTVAQSSTVAKEIEIFRSLRKVLDQRASQLNGEMRKIKSASARLLKQESKVDRYMKQVLNDAGIVSKDQVPLGPSTTVPGPVSHYYQPQSRSIQRRKQLHHDIDLEEALNFTSAEEDFDLHNMHEVTAPMMEIPRSIPFHGPNTMAPYFQGPYDLRPSIGYGVYNPSLNNNHSSKLLDQWLGILQSKVINDKEQESIRIDEERLRRMRDTAGPSINLNIKSSGGKLTGQGAGVNLTEEGGSNKSLALHLHEWASSRNQLRSALVSHVDWVRSVAAEVNQKMLKN